MADAPRARKLADRIQEIVARMLDTRIKDPRLGFVTVTDVRVTGDLQHATVFYTVLGTEEERDSSAAALASARGLIRSEVGKQTGLRLTPTVEFVLDAVPETAASLEEALRVAAEHDAEVARQAAAASYAAGADPYRRPAEEADDEDDSVAEAAADLDTAEAGAGADPLHPRTHRVPDSSFGTAHRASDPSAHQDEAGPGTWSAAEHAHPTEEETGR